VRRSDREITDCAVMERIIAEAAVRRCAFFPPAKEIQDMLWA
jgi:hypothetical protein